MIKVEIDIDELDYNALIDRYLPVMAEKLRQTNNPIAMLLSNGMPESVAKTVVKGLSQEKKEHLTAELFNANSAVLARQLEAFGRQNDVRFTVRGMRASG
jgi:hypothetical protein